MASSASILYSVAVSGYTACGTAVFSCIAVYYTLVYHKLLLSDEKAASGTDNAAVATAESTAVGYIAAIRSYWSCRAPRCARLHAHGLNARSPPFSGERLEVKMKKKRGIGGQKLG